MPETYVELRLNIQCRLKYDESLASEENALACFVHDLLGNTQEVYDPNTGNTVGEIELYMEGNDWAFVRSRR